MTTNSAGFLHNCLYIHNNYPFVSCPQVCYLFFQVVDLAFAGSIGGILV